MPKTGLKRAPPGARRAITVVARLASRGARPPHAAHQSSRLTRLFTMASEILAFVFVPYCLMALLVMCLVLVIVTMAPPPREKRRRVVLTMDKKREILGKLDKGWNIQRCSTTYGIPCNTLYDLRKNKKKILDYQAAFGKDTCHKVPRKVVSKPRHACVDEATLT